MRENTMRQNMTRRWELGLSAGSYVLGRVTSELGKLTVLTVVESGGRWLPR